MLVIWLTGDDSNLALQSLCITVSGNLLEFWNAFECALIGDWSDQLLAQSCEATLCDGRGGLWNIRHGECGRECIGWAMEGDDVKESERWRVR